MLWTKKFNNNNKLRVCKWNSIFMDKKITAGLVHYSYLVFFTGESYRLKNAISRIKGGAL